MVALTSIENTIIKHSKSSGKRKDSKMRRSMSPTNDQLTKMLEEECHNSFLKLPDEEPAFIWNTDEVEEHHHRMKKLDKKLNKYNDDIAKLKEMLKQADEKHMVTMERMERREQEARQEVVDLKENASKTADEQAAASEVQIGQLKARLQTNLHKMNELRTENKNLTKELRKKEKQLDKIRFHNNKLEESSTDLMNSYGDLGMEKVFDENNTLHDTLESGKEQFEQLVASVKAMQDRYMGEAKQRLEIQKTMATILYAIQGAGPQRGVSPELAKACTQIGMDCEARATALHERLQDEEEWRNMFAAEAL